MRIESKIPPQRRLTRGELNYLRMVYIVVKIFPKVLITVFKREWRRCTSLTWNDDPESGRQFWERESDENKEQHSQKQSTILNGDSSKFDNTDLFYIILNSCSVGESLRLHDQVAYSEINGLRKIRNEVIHRTDIEVRNKDFRVSFFAQVRGCFRRLEFSTEELEAAETVCFDEESESLRIELERERQRRKAYDDYFSWRNSRFEEFSRKFKPQEMSLFELRRKKIITDQDIEKLERQKDEKLKSAMIVDCVLFKGHTNASAFLSTPHRADNRLTESYTQTLPHNRLRSLKTELERERKQRRAYDDYFNWRNSRFKKFSRNYIGISPRELMVEGKLAIQDLDKIENQQNHQLKKAMITDCVFIKDQRNVLEFVQGLTWWILLGIFIIIITFSFILEIKYRH